MKKILSIILLFSFLYANDFSVETSGNLETSIINGKKESNTLFDLNINNDFYLYEKTKIGTSVGAYINTDKTYNNNVRSKVNRVNAYRINELYLTYYITEELMISFGVFPFLNGTFHEYSFNGNKSGIGLYTLSDSKFQGSIVTYNKDNYSLQFGSVGYEKYFRTNLDTEQSDGPITFDSYKDSGMDYISLKQYVDKWYQEVMLTNTYQYLNGVDIIDTNTYSYAVSYDDESVTGRTYYSILTLTDSKGDNSSLSPYGRFSNELYHFDEFKTHGYSWLLGFKQEFDNVIFNKDMVFGTEFIHRSDGYHSLLAGEPLSFDSYSNIGDTYNTYIGLRYDKNTIIKLRYYKYDAKNKMTKGILSPVSTNLVDDGANGNYEYLILQLYIDF